MNMDERQKQILRECERFGEEEVRRRFYAGEYSSPRDQSLIQGWLHGKETEREEALNVRREAREEESLSISRKAICISYAAIIIAIIAIVVPIIVILLTKK